VEAYGDHREALLGVLLVLLDEVRKALDARRAPRRPEVDEHDLPLRVGNRFLNAIDLARRDLDIAPRPVALRRVLLLIDAAEGDPNQSHNRGPRDKPAIHGSPLIASSRKTIPMTTQSLSRSSSGIPPARQRHRALFRVSRGC